jgi:acyl-CoA thioesterase FadM
MPHTHTNFHGFTYRTLVYVADATPFGQAYFVAYFEWQGRAREELFRLFLPTARELMDAFRIVTLESSVRYRRELLLHEPVAVEVRVEEITRASLALRFTYRHAERGDAIAEGRQRVVFTDQHGRILPLPNDVRHRALAYRHAHDGT